MAARISKHFTVRTAGAAIAALGLVSGHAFAQAAGGSPMAVPVPPSATGGGSYSGGGGGTTPVIMIVDGERILQQAKASVAINSQLDQQQQNYQKELNAKQTELEGEQSELQRQQRTLPPDQFEEKRHAFAKKMEDAQRDVDAKKRGLAKAFSDALDKVKRALVEIVGGLAQERHSNLVLLRSATIIADPAFDVTDEALKRLDQKLPYVQVSVSATEGGGAPAKK